MPNQSVSYIATRNLISGRVLLDPVNVGLNLRRKNRGRKAKKITATSLNNRRFITHLAGYATWKCQTPPLRGADADLMREFLDSCEDQIFSWDPNNATGASPNDNRNVVLASNGYTEQMAAQQASQADNYFVFTFSMDEVA